MDVSCSYIIGMGVLIPILTLLGVFSDNFNLVMIGITIYVLFMVIGMLVIFKKSKTTHTCPVCQNTIGKTGTTISW